jgi:hypothetical protein
MELAALLLFLPFLNSFPLCSILVLYACFLAESRSQVAQINIYLIFILFYLCPFSLSHSGGFSEEVN